MPRNQSNYLVATPIVAAEFNLESLDVRRQQKGEQVERRGARPRRAGAIRRWRAQQSGSFLQQFRPYGAGQGGQVERPQDFPGQTQHLCCCSVLSRGLKNTKN